MFSAAFRRLSRKTQVHPLAANDHVHTRLTHSLETGQVGKALGKTLFPKIAGDLPKDISGSELGTILQAACLAHDIGNPPFGHAGEEAMMHWFDLEQDQFSVLGEEEQTDLKGFDGNAQGFRILAQTENNLFSGGLRLTYATLGAFLKYPNTRSTAKKFGAFVSEAEILDDVANELGLISKGEHAWCRHPLAYLVEAADDICYCILDLEDAVELQILEFTHVSDLLLTVVSDPQATKIREALSPPEMFRINLSRLRGPVFSELVYGAVEGFIKAYPAIMAGNYDGDVFGQLDRSDARRQLIEESKKIGREKIYVDAKKIEIELGCSATFDTLLRDLCSAAIARAEQLRSGKPLRWKQSLIMKMLADHAPDRSKPPANGEWTEYQCLRRAIDYVSGMTDNYAVYVAKQLQGTGFAGIQRP